MENSALVAVEHDGEHVPSKMAVVESPRVVSQMYMPSSLLGLPIDHSLS